MYQKIERWTSEFSRVRSKPTFIRFNVRWPAACCHRLLCPFSRLLIRGVNFQGRLQG